MAFEISVKMIDNQIEMNRRTVELYQQRVKNNWEDTEKAEQTIKEANEVILELQAARKLLDGAFD